MDYKELAKMCRYLSDTPSYTAFHDEVEREVICDSCKGGLCYEKEKDAHWCMYEALQRAANAITNLMASCTRLEESRERANEAAHKWEGRCKILETRLETAEKMVKEYQDTIVPGYRERAEKAERERDAAVSDIETILAYGDVNLDTCQYCKNGQCYARGGTKPCFPKWRGAKGE